MKIFEIGADFGEEITCPICENGVLEPVNLLSENDKAKDIATELCICTVCKKSFAVIYTYKAAVRYLRKIPFGYNVIPCGDSASEKVCPACKSRNYTVDSEEATDFHNVLGKFSHCSCACGTRFNSYYYASPKWAITT